MRHAGIRGGGVGEGGREGGEGRGGGMGEGMGGGGEMGRRRIRMNHAAFAWGGLHFVTA